MDKPYPRDVLATPAPPRKMNAGRHARHIVKLARLQPAPAVQEQVTAQEAFIFSEIDRVTAEISSLTQRLSANICMWFVWLIGWLLNGAATVLWSVSLGASFGALLLSRGWIETAPTPGNWALIGVCLHLLISRVEQYLWKPDRWATPPSMRNFQAWRESLGPRMAALGTVRTLQAVVIGSLDSLSSARAGLVLAGAFTPAAVVLCGIMGTGLAMSAEPMMGYHWRQVRPQWRQLCSLRSELSRWQSALLGVSL